MECELLRTRRKYMRSVGICLLLSVCIGCGGVKTVGTAGNRVIEKLSDVNIFTDAEERQFGEAYVAAHEKQVKLYTDPVVTNYINLISGDLTGSFS